MGVREGPRGTSRGGSEAIAKPGDAPSKVALHSSRIGAFTTLAAVGEVAQRMIPMQGRWKSSKSFEERTRSNLEDAGMVFRKLAKTGKIEQYQPGQGTVEGLTP